MISTDDTLYYVLCSHASNSSQGGSKPKVRCYLGREIKGYAAGELQRCGERLEDLAGIEWMEDEDGNVTPARNLTDDEILKWSAEKLSDDGRMWSIFAPNETAEFVEDATWYGLGDEARALVELCNPKTLRK